MKIFIAGTDTNVVKTLISSWLCMHSGYDYFKPIQAGNLENTDKAFVSSLTNSKIYDESYIFKNPLSPHLASKLEKITIDTDNIKLPANDKLIIEGAGGVLVPINDNNMMIDVIQKFNLPVILVTRSTLGTINHTCLTLEALRARKIKVLGIIMNGTPNLSNKQAIELYGRSEVLAEFPKLETINRDILQNIPLTNNLKDLL
jgi:dethiobiotin synthetase